MPPAIPPAIPPDLEGITQRPDGNRAAYAELGWGYKKVPREAEEGAEEDGDEEGHEYRDCRVSQKYGPPILGHQGPGLLEESHRGDQAGVVSRNAHRLERKVAGRAADRWMMVLRIMIEEFRR